MSAEDKEVQSMLYKVGYKLLNARGLFSGVNAAFEIYSECCECKRSDDANAAVHTFLELATGVESGRKECHELEAE